MSLPYFSSSPLINKGDSLIRGRGVGLVPCTSEQQHCRQVRPSNARYYYNKARNSIYTRFSNCEWDEHNLYLKCVAKSELALARQSKACAWSTVAEASARTNNRMIDNKMRLAKRIRDVYEMQKLEMEERDKMEESISLLKLTRQDLLNLLEELKILLAVGEESMLKREQRSGMEQILDNGEKALTKEVLHIRNSRIILKDYFDTINDQISIDRDAQLALVTDIRNKRNTTEVDVKAHKLNICSRKISYHGRIEDYAPTVTDEESWLEFALEILDRSYRERSKTDELRENVLDVIRREKSTMFQFVDYINENIKNRLAVIMQVKGDLEEHLKQVDKEIVDLERTSSLLKCSIKEKETHLMLTQSKINQRTVRFCTENTRDSAYIGLQAEAYELRDTITSLKERLRCVEASLCRLTKTRLQLISDIKNKHCNVQLDSKCTLPLHQAINPRMALADTKKLLCSMRC